MRVDVIPQVELGGIRRARIGDLLNSSISDDDSIRFRFSVAYMRVSGLNRLSVSLDSLLNRGGRVSGAIGIDDGITSLEALEMLGKISSDSTIFHTISGYIYHPKLYLIDYKKSALAVVGSANLTRDGLFRNVEIATAVHLDFEDSVDYKVYERYDLLISEFLNTLNPNVQPINEAILKKLKSAGSIKPEATTREPGPETRTGRTKRTVGPLESLFPPLRIPVAPPQAGLIKSTAVRKKLQKVIEVVVPPVLPRLGNTFLMQLSAFDSSHREGVPGTPEVLIPHKAIPFFPRLSLSGRKYPDALFDVALNSPDGQERQRYRLWYYEQRATGTKIDEYRLRLNHETISLSSSGGGDLLVINKLPSGSDPSYEVTILPQTDPTFPAFLSFCTEDAQGKKWGIV